MLSRSSRVATETVLSQLSYVPRSGDDRTRTCNHLINSKKYP